MQKWEYKRITLDSFDELEELGEDGWELVSMIRDAFGLYRCYFKRPKA